MRRRALAATAAVIVAVITAACSSISTSGTSSASGAAAASACSGSALQSDLYARGQLTVATDSPVYSPWFEDNKPANGQGYESAVAYAVAAQLGFSKSQVKWVTEPFDSSYAPGPKKFDFDINEISYSPQRAQAVSLSDSYYDVQQSLVVLKGSPLLSKHTPAELKTYAYGDQIGTTSLSFINTDIQPARTPKVYNTLSDVAQALATRQIDAFVTDTPTAQYITSSSEIPHSVLAGQFPSTGEHYSLLLNKGSGLTACANKALSTLRADGTLAALQKKWLGVYTSVPTIKP